MQKLIMLVLFFVSATQLFANQQDCYFLGPQPSFVIRFLPSVALQNQPQLNAALLGQLSAKAGVQFTASKAMFARFYVMHFDPKSNVAVQNNVNSACYKKQVIDTIMKKLRADNMVESVEPNPLLGIPELQQSPEQAQSQIRMPKQLTSSWKPWVQGIWDITQWNLNAIDTEKAWAINRGKPSSVVAVLDTGILNNNDLNSNIIGPGLTFSVGYAYSGNTPSCLYDNTPNGCLGADHGTNVSGVVAALGNGSYGETIYGVGPGLHVLPVNVFTRFADESVCGTGEAPCVLAYFADVANAENWVSGSLQHPSLPAVPSGIHVINLSLGGPDSCYSYMQMAINDANSHNITTVVAAGNSDEPTADYTPANCPNVISVTATNKAGARTFYSNYGSSSTLAAPGGDYDNYIRTTTEDGYQNTGGTSFSAPHVAGVIGLLTSIQPSLTVPEIKSILQGSVQAFPSVGGGTFDCNNSAYSCGIGILNAFEALRMIQKDEEFKVEAPTPADLVLQDHYPPYPFPSCPSGEKMPTALEIKKTISASGKEYPVIFTMTGAGRTCLLSSAYSSATLQEDNEGIYLYYGDDATRNRYDFHMAGTECSIQQNQIECISK
jgi:subtilisin family serine protease